MLKVAGLINLLFLMSTGLLKAQDEDAQFIKKIHDIALTEGKAYQWLHELCTQYPGRIAGSQNDRNAALYTQSVLKSLKLSGTMLQECVANYWKRGELEQAVMTDYNGVVTPLKILSLGNSVATPSGGISAEVIEVLSLEEVEKLGKDVISGKIVFFNRPMDPTQLRTFSAYGGAADQRVYGPSKAAEYGAVGAIVRSLTLKNDDNPHTGVTVYRDEHSKIAGVGISTNDADKLSNSIKKGKTKVFLNTDCLNMGPRKTYNVIGEIKGSTYPDDIILVGGHLDSWDVGQGAHDDGAGCVQAMDVLNILIRAGYKPERTIRCVLFANEENGLAGGIEYARISNENKEFHLAALESDAGGFSPRGFSFEADTSVFKKYYRKVYEWSDILASYGLHFEIGGSGADISPLKSQKGLLIGLRPDSQRYFDYHHTATDTFEAVNKRELELGAAAMTSLVFLIDKYGL
ncbi:MAG: M20/M25/M40 family metallo-hydrolase [Saprospiraceae bacterium]|nr:M20/M25/M40 family metallo-hydrolase [Saprospiraceae bacterium]